MMAFFFYNVVMRKRKSKIILILSLIIVLCFLVISLLKVVADYNIEKIVEEEVIEIVPDIDIKHTLYYSCLNDTEKDIYKCLEKYVSERQEKIIIPEASDQEVSRAVQAYYFTNPQYYWLNTNFMFGYESLNYNTTYFIKFDLQEDYSQEINAIADQIVNNINEDDDVERLRIIYDYIINNTTYNKDNFEESQTLISALIGKQSVCAGYSSAFCYLANKMGYECYVVNGTGEDHNGVRAGHSWNIICLDNNYYWIDPTWGETIINDVEYNPNYDYFLVGDEEMLINHFPDGNFQYPECTKK